MTLAYLSLLLRVLALAIASNLDNFGVGAAFGMDRTRVPWLANLVIAAIGALATALAMVAGGVLARIDLSLMKALGAAVIGCIGLVIIIRSLLDSLAARRQTELCRVFTLRARPLKVVISILLEPSRADADRSGVIDLVETPALGLALGANCFAGGFAAGLMAYPVVLTSLAVGLGSYVAIYAGWSLGRVAGARWFGRWAGTLAGVILVALAFIEWFEG